MGEASDPKSENRRAAGKQRQGGKGPQRRANLQHRCRNADALGDIVEGETKHQERAKARRARREGGADGQSLAEIVQPDAERDERRERHAGRSSAAPARRQEQKEARCGRQNHHDLTLEDGGGLSRKLQRLARGVDHQEGQEPDRHGKKEVHAAAPDTAQRRIEHQSNGDRHDAAKAPSSA